MLLRHNPEIEVLEHLHDNAAKHADASGGLFYVDPFNPKNLEDYMWLAPSVRSHENMAATGNRIPADQLANIAPVVDRRISNLVSPEYLVTDPEHKIALSLAGEFLSNGYNVALGQSHNEPTDIALDLGVKSIWLEREGVKHSTAIILSKGFDFLKINTSNFTIDPGIVRTFLEGLGMTVDQNGLLPLRSFLGILADKSYFVIPDSASFSEIRKKQTEKIRKFNAAAIQLIQHDLRGEENDDSSAGTLLSLALTGTTAKPIDISALKAAEEQLSGAYQLDPPIETIPDTVDDIYAIGGINPRVVEYLQYCFTFASGIVLEEDPADTRQDIRPEFIIAKNTGDERRLGHQLIKSLSKLKPEVTFVQDLKHNLPSQATSSS